MSTGVNEDSPKDIQDRDLHRVQGTMLLTAAAVFWTATRRQRARGGGQWSGVLVSWLLAQAAFQTLKSEVLGLLHSLARRTDTDLDDRILALVGRELKSRWAIAVASYAALRYGPAPPSEWLSHYKGPLARADWLARAVAASLLALRGSALVTESVKAVVETSVESNHQLAAKPFINFTRAACMALSGLFIGGSLGLNVQNLIAGLGIGGVAVALGVQTFVQDFFGAASILVLNRPFTVGSYIRINGQWGRVESVGLNATRLRDNDAVLHIIPNATVSTSQVSIGDPGWNYGTVRVELSASTAPDQLKAFADLARSVITSPPEAFAKPCRFYSCELERISEWGFEFALVFEVVVKDEEQVSSEEVASMASILRLGIVEALARAGVSLASKARLDAVAKC